MVYKIRNKAFFFTLSGYKNNYCPKVLNLPVDVKSDTTFCFKTYDGGPELIRFCQLYRSISRKVKQYLYGNKEVEEHVLNVIRQHFKIPFLCDTPINLITSEPIRRFLNQGDRDYELLSYNTHPYQMDLYRSVNESVQEEVEYLTLKDNGETPLEEQLPEVLGKHLEELNKRYNGNVPTAAFYEAMQEVYTKFVAAKGAEKSRTPNGDFNDFLEVRRPFVEPNVTNQNVKTA